MRTVSPRTFATSLGMPGLPGWTSLQRSSLSLDVGPLRYLLPYRTAHPTTTTAH